MSDRWIVYVVLNESMVAVEVRAPKRQMAMAGQGICLMLCEGDLDHVRKRVVTEAERHEGFAALLASSPIALQHLGLKHVTRFEPT